ncbi:MAG: hypothetical protein ACJ77V_11705 [Chloroflexota bacterium]
MASASVDHPEAIPEPYLLPEDDEAGTVSIWPSIPEPLDEHPSAILTGRPYRVSGGSESAGTATTVVPGAYRLSALTLASATAETGAAGPAAVVGEQRATGPIDPARLADIAGWFVIVGATMAVLGFLLPWSSIVIGARSAGSYFDSWGLASPTHVVVLAATLLVLGLGIVRTSVPLWLRSGVMPLALGSLLLGLVWPYEVGPLGADVGVLVVGLGGLAMVVGGVLTTAATRHAGVDPLV